MSDSPTPPVPPPPVIPPEADRPLVDLLASLHHRPFLLIRPGGNWGDGLIYAGLEHLADALGLAWSTAAYEQLGEIAATPEHVIYHHGGGGLNRWSSGRAAKALAWALESPARTVIQGPCTVENDRAYADSVIAWLKRGARGRDLHFFAREQVTHDLMAPLAAHAALHLNDDTAFYTHVPSLPGGGGGRKPTYKLLALRADQEAPATAQGTLRDWVRLDPAYFGGSFPHWLDLHARAERILTNRTHSSIAGCLLGVPTVLLDNAYHKNRSIWEYSLARRGVGWGTMADLDLQPLEPSPGAAFMTAKSWKLRRLAHWLQGVPVG